MFVLLQNDNSLTTKENAPEKAGAYGSSRALFVIIVKYQALPRGPHTWNTASLESFQDLGQHALFSQNFAFLGFFLSLWNLPKCSDIWGKNVTE